MLYPADEGEKVGKVGWVRYNSWETTIFNLVSYSTSTNFVLTKELLEEPKNQLSINAYMAFIASIRLTTALIMAKINSNIFSIFCNKVLKL